MLVRTFKKSYVWKSVHLPWIVELLRSMLKLISSKLSVEDYLSIKKQPLTSYWLPFPQFSCANATSKADVSLWSLKFISRSQWIGFFVSAFQSRTKQSKTQKTQDWLHMHTSTLQISIQVGWSSVCRQEQDLYWWCSWSVANGVCRWQNQIDSWYGCLVLLWSAWGS